MNVTIDNSTGELSGTGVTRSTRKLSGMLGYYHDHEAWSAMNPDLTTYLVESYMPLPEGTEGAVCLATTWLMPGRVGDEFFVTRGHFHANPDRPELCVTIKGEGVVVLMDSGRHTRTEPMTPGSVHHVPVNTAHRCANTGTEALVFVSYWTSETGHDYATIQQYGFSSRVAEISGTVTLVPNNA